ncbi:NAD(P)/FAD-dependent oxidoreductase [Comamonas testosteroni]|uniref:NADH:flavin oxidoreductase/NADH oxidase n=1 Tax=Comamonas testosteroni (strain DSM 14576 / KF-1) TaxID=399795 RepID=B7X4V5_COMTK|nr:NAD(P)/FAD-dependent oxidoreductase [Comamonas testosteroni]EED68733.1 NADH:flavin oxidoreductase/NADH oxidase [Comamonas testosteroni KF-1]WQG66734.1 NAD(P)/FAD-dependent oxidoreductase [Comamonas testosteroni]
MNNPHASLLQTGRIGSMELKNRVAMAPMGENFGGDDGCCGERTQAYYEARAQGGTGLIIMGTTAISWPSGTSEPHQLGISNDSFIPGLAEVTRRVHAHGGKIAVQINHSGKVAAHDRACGREMWVSSMPPDGPVHDGMRTITPKEFSTFVGVGPFPERYRIMDKADIAQMVEWFAAAALRAKQANFDAVEVHCAHNYMIANFLSPFFNSRTDEYGGSYENRSRLLREVLTEVRRRVGPDYPVWVRLDAQEMHTPGGITMDEALKTARLCEELGMDAISVSAYARMPTGSAFTDAPIPQKQNAYREFARQFKQSVSLPIISAGRWELDDAADAVTRGEIDFVAMGRKLLAEPDMVNKLQANAAGDVRPCIYCYACVSEIFVNRGIKCAVNALTGHEAVKTIAFAAKPRHVLIVGGGPSGMEAARVAALRGHRVTLVERSDRLGGTLFFAALAYPENGRLLDYLVRQMDHPNIQLRLNTTVDDGLLAELQPDEILVGTGARRAAPAIEGAQQSHVWSGDELRRLMTGDRADEIAKAKLNLAERALFKAGGMLKVTDSTAAIQNLSKLWMPLGKRVVIIGAGLVGLELAEFLLDRGREVTVLDPGTHPGTELAIVRRWRVYDTVKNHGKLLMQSSVTRIERKEVVWTDKKGEEYRTPADSVVLAIGAEADSSVAEQLQALTRIPVRRIGDCRDLGYIEGAMHSGHQAGREV